MSNLEKYNLQTAEEPASEVSDAECPCCCPCCAWLCVLDTCCCPCLSGCAEGYSDYD